MNQINGTLSIQGGLSGSINSRNTMSGVVTSERKFTGDITQTILRGVGIKRISQLSSSMESEGQNIWEIELTDGTKTNLVLYNGGTGNPGEKGENGKSPYFNKKDGRWYEWDDAVQSYMPSEFRPEQGLFNPATNNSIGGIIVGDNLKINSEGVLSVDTSSSMYDDNTKPITSAAVYKEVGNIGALLQTI